MSGGRKRACITGLALAALALVTAPSAAALTTRTASDSTEGPNGLLKATAECKAGEHVVSGWFSTPDQGYAFISRAKGDDAWTVSAEADAPLYAFAYCSDRLRVSTRSDSKEAPAPGGTRVNAKAKCHRGESAVSGGYEIVDADIDEDDLVAFNSRRKGKRSWGVSGFNDSGVDTTLEVFVYCMRDVDLKVRSAKSDPIPDDTAGSAKAKCRNGEELLSGGYKTSPKPDYENKVGPDHFYFRSSRSGPRSWKASADNYSDVPGTITAYAYCLA